MDRFGTLDLIVVLVYLIGIGALGIYQTVKVKTSGDYFAGGRKFSKWLMVMHGLGTGTHADDPVGVAGAAYQRGISGIWYTYVYLFLTPFYWVIAPFFRRSRYITTADFFEARFGKGLGALYAVMGMLTFSINTGTLLKGTGAIATAVTGGQISEPMAIWGMTVVFVLYGFFGGLIATVVTESIQGVLIVVMSLLLIPFGLQAIGGAAELHQFAGDRMFSLAAPVEMTVPWIIAGSIINLIGIVAQPHIMEVCSTGKTEWEGRVGFTYGNFIKRFCAMGWAFTGVIIVAMVAKGVLSAEELSEQRELAFGIAIRELLPAGLTGLMFASVLAAQMSSLSAFMVAGAALIARNLYGRYINPGASDRTILKIGRVMGLLVVGLGVLFAYLFKSVADALLIFWAVSVFTGLFMWFGVLWRRTNPTGAWLSFFVMLILWLVVGPIGREVNDARNLRFAVPANAGLDITTKTEWVRNLDGGSAAYRVLVNVESSEQAAAVPLTFTVKTHDAILSATSPAGEIALADRLPATPGGSSTLVFRPHPDTVRFMPKVRGEGFHLRHKPDPDQPSHAVALHLQVRNWSRFAGRFAQRKDLHWMVLSFLPAGIVVLVLGSILGPKQDVKLLDNFYLLLRTPVGQEKKLEEAGVPVIYSGETKPHPWETNHPWRVNLGGFVVGLVFAVIILFMLYGLAAIGSG